MIQITSKKEGFRRCGIAHSRTPTDYPVDHFTLAELEILGSEPMLSVTVVDDPVDAAKAKADADAKPAPGKKADKPTGKKGGK